MSSLDNGEDEVDYGETEDQNASSLAPAFQLSARSSLPPYPLDDDDDAIPDDGYEDLYDDVDIVFEPPSSDISKPKDSLDSGEDFERAPRDPALPPSAARHFADQRNHVEPGDFKKQVVAATMESVPGGPTGNGNKLFGSSPGMQAAPTHVQTALIRESKASEPPLLANEPVMKALSKDKGELEMESAYSLASQGKVKHENMLKPITLETKSSISSQARNMKGNDSGLEEPMAGLKASENYSRASMVEHHVEKKAFESNIDKLKGGESFEQDAYQGGANRVSVEPAPQNDYAVKSSGQSNGCTMLFVGELHWWTTDVELETALSEYGVLKNLKFYEERASGKSKGYCQVEYFDHAAALACKENMNGRKFHGRPCLVAFANPRTIIQMGTAQVDKAQAQLRAQQAQTQSRRTVNDNSGNTRGATSYQVGDNARGYGRQNTGIGRGNHAQTLAGRGSARGRTNTVNKGMNGNTNMAGINPYGQGIVGPMGAGLMMPQAMIGQGYDPSYGPPRGGAGYGGYVLPGPPFTGMVQPFPSMAPGTLAGVAPHVNPAFFGRNGASNGMGMMAANGMDGSAWGDATMTGWGQDDHDRRGREASYGDDMGGSDYTYSNELAYERSRGAKESDRADAEWPDRHRQREKEGYREQRGRERDGEKEDDWEKGRSRNKGRSMMDEDERQNQRGRSKEEDYGKRRRLATDR